MNSPAAYANPAFIPTAKAAGAAGSPSLGGGRSLWLLPAAALHWAGGLLRRLAVLDDLRSLSDDQLADIGLRRADLHRVFDPAFVAARKAGRPAV
jgi:hypothetical protein